MTLSDIPALPVRAHTAYDLTGNVGAMTSCTLYQKSQITASPVSHPRSSQQSVSDFTRP